MPRYLLSVGFKVEPVEVVVEAESMKEAWANAVDLAGAAGAEPQEYELDPYHINTFEPAGEESTHG